MSKSIKVSQENYIKIQALLRARETYNDVITRLIRTHESAGQLLDTIEGGLRFQEDQRERLRGPVDADAVRRDIEARTIKEART